MSSHQGKKPERTDMPAMSSRLLKFAGIGVEVGPPLLLLLKLEVPSASQELEFCGDGVAKVIDSSSICTPSM